VRGHVAQVALIVAGLLIALYPVTLGASPSLACRGVPMGPGQQCAKADGSAAQTYEDRLRTANSARPVIAVVGLSVAGFGVALLAGRRRRQSPSLPR
jgi:hypothetical protein